MLCPDTDLNGSHWCTNSHFVSFNVITEHENENEDEDWEDESKSQDFGKRGSIISGFGVT